MNDDKMELQRVESAPPILAANDILTTIVRAARDPSVDVEKMERLVQLHERITARQAEMEFNDALRMVQSQIPPIVKHSKNSSTNSAYAKLEDIKKIVNPILFDNGFSLSFGTSQSQLPNHYGITAVLSHKGGHTRNYACDVPADTHGPKGTQNKTATHGFGSAVSYGERYLLKLMLNIRLIGEDDDGNLGDRPKPQGPSTLHGVKTVSAEDIALKRSLMDMTRDVHKCVGYRLTDEGKAALTQYLIDECIIEDTQTVGDLAGAALAAAVRKLETKHHKP